MFYEAVTAALGIFSVLIAAWVVRGSRACAGVSGNGAARAKLEESQRATKIATEMNTRFVRALAHDLREPIRGVVNFADLLLDHELDEQRQRQLLERLRSAAHRAHDQLGELRAFALDQNGEEAHDPMSMMPLGDMLDEAMAVLDASITTTGAHIEVRAEANAASQRYPAALRRVFTNLIENSLKYAGDEPQIEVRARVFGDGTLEVRFEDDGPGIDPKDAARIFEPYERLDEHEKEKPGLGMGLAICREIVTRLGGEIWALGRGKLTGAVFVIRLQTDAAPASHRRQR